MKRQSGFNQTTPKELILLAQKGDIDAFEQIYRLFSSASYSLSYRICGQKALAEDSVHEAFVKIMKNINQFKSKGSFAGWCRRIVTFETINRVKQMSRLSLVSDEVLEFSGNLDLFDHMWIESRIDLKKLMQSLSPLSRAVFSLHEIEGYNHKEIAQLFGKSVSFSKVTLSRAYKTLRQEALSDKQDRKNAPEQ